MKYRTFVSVPTAPTLGDGAATQPTSPNASFHQPGLAQEPAAPAHNIPRPEYGVPRNASMHRMPPVLQFIVPVDPNLSRYLMNAAMQRHLAGGDSRAVCDEIYMTALRQGYHVTINVQEVVAAGMPSFPGQRILTTLVMVDLQRS